MSYKLLAICILATVTSAVGNSTATVWAQSLPAAPNLQNRNYPLIIDGTATMVGRWACGGDAKVDTITDSSAEPTSEFAGELQKVVVTTLVPAIDCGDSTMNKHLRKALKDKEFPEIRYQALKYTMVDDGSAVQTSGELTIAGVTKPIGLGAKLIPVPGGGTRVVGKVEINMRDYGVKPPSLFFGALKVADVVTVQFDTVVQLPRELTMVLFARARKS